MTFFETYSKRKNKEKQKDNIDVYKYDEIPRELRVQIIYILNDSILDGYWEEIHNILARERGVFTLHGNCTPNHYEECKKTVYDFLLETDVNGVLDLVDLSFQIIDNKIRDLPPYDKVEVNQDPDEAIKELNHRFKEHNVGYEFASGKIIRIDSKHMHEEVVKPTINLLYKEEFEGANEEFLKAHEHYRKENYKEAIAETLKSFESTMKIICERKEFEFDKKRDTASTLISILIDNEFIPKYITSHFTGLRTTLESGLPTLRNKTSGHGQGNEPIKVPRHFVEYAINLAATNIMFLVKTYIKSK